MVSIMKDEEIEMTPNLIRKIQTSKGAVCDYLIEVEHRISARSFACLV